jgi:hypothetical protein
LRVGARNVALVTGIARARAQRRTRHVADSVFLWIPKTAGTSLWTLLEARGGGLYTHPNRVRWVFPDRGLASFGHMRYQDLVNAGLVSRRFDHAAYKFTVVRDPFDRAVSLYHHVRTRGWLASEVSFESFTELLGERRWEPIGLFNKKGLSQCNPQVEWLVDDDGSLLVDEVGRFEDMTTFLGILRERLGIAGELPHVNQATERSELGGYYVSSAARENVARAYARDLEAFGY